MWRFNKDGLSKAFPHTSQGNNARSDFAGLLWIFGVMSNNSFDEPADDEVRESPDIDLCSSSAPDGGDIGSRTRDRRDVDRSNGVSVKDKLFLIFLCFYAISKNLIIVLYFLLQIRN